MELHSIVDTPLNSEEAVYNYLWDSHLSRLYVGLHLYYYVSEVSIPYYGNIISEIPIIIKESMTNKEHTE